MRSWQASQPMVGKVGSQLDGGTGLLALLGLDWSENHSKGLSTGKVMRYVTYSSIVVAGVEVGFLVVFVREESSGILA